MSHKLDSAFIRCIYHMSVQIFRILSSLAVLTYLQACSLEPYYSKYHSNKSYEKLSSIEIVPVSSVYGAEYYDILVQILHPEGESKYLLYTDLSFSKEISILQSNSDVLREEAVVNVRYSLVQKSNLQEITSGHFRRNVSYSTTFGAYVNQTRSNHSCIQLAKSVAHEIRNRLVLYFTN